VQRSFKNILYKWKDHPLRVPLIVRGARQVGKTFVIQSFGNEKFKNLVTLNFEISPHLKTCFDTIEPHMIIRQLELLTQKRIEPGETLLFLDEVQQCPKALQALRYFKEELPELHLIAAGSLLDFAIHEEDFSFPVGRVQFARLYPLSFEEYLEACGHGPLKDALSSYDCKDPPPAAVHHILLERLKEYCLIGGMPAAIMAYLNTHSFLEVNYVLKSLWDAFEADFGKYARKAQHRHLKKIFTETPRLLGEHVKYSRIDPELPNPAREMKQAIELLKLAGLLHPISATSAGGLPLLAGLKENIFKLLFLDIGLLSFSMGLDAQSHLMVGPFAEQLVGQELLAAADPFLETKLFFWTRDSGSAEVDYLYAHKGTVFPIEVKAGKGGKLKSLHLFIKEKSAPFGIKISQDPLSWNHQLLTVPFYLTAHLPRLIDQALTEKSRTWP
jgi:uncharacterized protein